MMKKMMMALMVSLMMTTTVMAQEEQQADNKKMRKIDPTTMIQKRTEAIVKKYGLNDEQAQKLQELNKKYGMAMRPRMGRAGGRPEGNGTRPELTEDQKKKMEERRKQREESMAAYNAELQTILTADQYKSYQADMQKRMMRMPKQER